MQSLLENISPADVIPDPFPHVAIQSPLKSWMDYDSLERSFPHVPLPKSIQPNTAYRFSAAQWMKLTPLEQLEFGNWEITRKFNMGPAFIRDFVRVFGFYIDHYYGRKFCRELLKANVTTRGIGSDADIFCDFQYVVNTPATEHGTTVRDPHCDNPLELFAGLWYFPQPGDSQNGGDLELYFRADEKQPVKFHRSKWGKGSVDASQLGPSIIYPYSADAFVMFLNTPDSIHSVTPRLPGMPLRRYVNIIAEIKKPLFSLTQ